MAKRLAALGFLFLLHACGTHAVRVTDVWFDRAADFKSLQTFTVRAIPTSADVSDALARDIESSIRSHLEGRGYREVEDAPDFVVVTDLERANMVNSARVQRTAGAAVAMTILTGERNREIWRATGSANAPDRTLERMERVKQTVDLMLRRFPPKPEEY